MSFCLSPSILAQCCIIGQKEESLPPPTPLSCAAPGEAGNTRGGALFRFTAEDSGNSCQPMSNADSQPQPAPQRRGLRPLKVQICSCQNRAPPGCATLFCSRVTHATARACPTGAGDC